MIFLFILITTVIFSFDASATSVDISLTYNNASAGGGRMLHNIGPAPPPWLIGVSPFSHSQLVFESRGAATSPQSPPVEGTSARRAQASPSPSLNPVTTTFTLSVPGLQLTRSFFIANCAGFVVGVLVFAVGSISGANLNPAVTVGLAITQKMSSFRATCYVAAQCAGATAGSLLARSVAPNLFVAAGGGMNGASTADRDIIGTWTIMGAEILGTSVLVFTVCAAADVGREKNNKYQSALTPLMIGFAVRLPYYFGGTAPKCTHRTLILPPPPPPPCEKVMVSHLILIPIDGCSINPARSFGAALAMGNFNDQWIFWFGPLLGGAGSALVYANLFSAYTAPVTMAEPKGDASDTVHAQSSAAFALGSGQSGDADQSSRHFYDASPPPTPTLMGSTDRNERLMVAQGQIGALKLQQGRGQTWANARDAYGSGASDAIPEYR